MTPVVLEALVLFVIAWFVFFFLFRFTFNVEKRKKITESIKSFFS